MNGSSRIRLQLLAAVAALAGVLVQSGPVYAQPTSVLAMNQIQANGQLSDILNHPAFSGFSEHLMPWPNRTYNSAMQLRDLGSLLPYHTNVTSQEVVASLNHMVEDVEQGEQIFYPLYDSAEVAADPSKADTGLFFLRGEPNAPFAMIAPGGGFAYVGSIHEGFPYATALNNHGLNAFVVRYRVGQGQITATEDFARAISFVFQHAQELKVSSKSYSVWGSSAGARMAALIGSHGTRQFGADDLPKPAAVIMAYTGHSDVAEVEPPTFVVVGENDGIAPPSAMQRRIGVLRERGTQVEFHPVQEVGHGFGTGVGTNAEGWIDDAVKFWRNVM